jgi:hypothetical protein
MNLSSFKNYIVSRHFKITLLILILFIGGFFRFYNLNWDNVAFYHPDEITVSNMVMKISIPDKLDPEFYSYNALPAYIYRGALQFVQWYTKDPLWTTDISRVMLTSRFVSAFFSTATILLVFMIGRRLKNAWVGLIAAFLLACSIVFIQHAHFIVTETILIFFLCLMIFFCIMACRERSRPFSTKKRLYWLFAAMSAGCAIGCKMTAIFFLIIPCFYLLLRFFESFGKVSNEEVLPNVGVRHDVSLHWDNKLFWRNLFDLIIDGFYFLCVTAVFFFISTPYSIFNFDKFLKAIEFESGMVSGKIPVPYTIQYADTPSYLFHIYNLNWSMSPIIPLIGFLGLLLWLYVIIFKSGERSRPLVSSVYALPLIFFSFIFFFYIGGLYTKFMRYMMPIIPILCLGAGFMIWYGLTWANLNSKKLKYLVYIFFTLVLLIPFFWAISYMSVYSKPSTWRSASLWMMQNLPSNSLIANEHWDYSIPHTVEPYHAEMFMFEQLKPYDSESTIKFQEMADTLSRADYVVIASKRLTGSIPREPDKYPLTTKYYKKLFGDKLGYKIIKRFESYPTLGPFVFNDDNADESFQVYDHSPVIVFQNEGHFSKQALFDLLMNEN